VARDATWQSIVEVRQVFPAADGVPLRKGKRTIVVTVFNIGGNNFRLITTVSYRAQLIDVWGVLTHAEYDKEQWKRWFA
jgi:mRNA interferase HigB